MVDDWILDVLTDLRQFALMNGLCVTEERLAQTLTAAACELDARHRDAHGTALMGHAGKFSQPIESGHKT